MAFLLNLGQNFRKENLAENNPTKTAIEKRK
jgi:hypothetical protein